jgi:hypothetical protein
MGYPGCPVFATTIQRLSDTYHMGSFTARRQCHSRALCAREEHCPQSSPAPGKQNNRGWPWMPTPSALTEEFAASDSTQTRTMRDYSVGWRTLSIPNPGRLEKPAVELVLQDIVCRSTRTDEWTGNSSRQAGSRASPQLIDRFQSLAEFAPKTARGILAQRTL